MKRRRILEVEWDDSATLSRWGYEKEHTESSVAKCRSVGYLIERNEKHIVLALNASDETGRVGDTISIPAACVRKVRRIDK